MTAVRHVLHVVPTLNQGGAERVLLSIIQSDRTNRHSVVKLFAGSGLFDERVEREAVAVYNLDLPRNMMAFALLPLALVRLMWRLLRVRPTAVVGWLYYGALMASVGRVLGLSVVWSIHAADFDPNKSYNLGTRIAIRLCRAFSSFVPNFTHFCSAASRDHHARIGFCVQRSCVIENAIDIDGVIERTDSIWATADIDAIATSREVGCKLICCIARFEAQKDHRTLLQALGALKASGRSFVLFLAGRGCYRDNLKLTQLIEEFDLQREVTPIGVVSDVERLIRYCDATVLSSSEGEALPMVLLEALALGKPVIATDVGGVAELVGGFGIVVQKADPSAMSDAIERVLWQEANKWATAAASAPASIRRRYSIVAAVERWNALFNKSAPC